MLTALGKLGVEPINAYMVGDTGDDILAGKNAGVKTVGVTYGFLGKDIAQYNPDFIIDDIEELFKILI
ncbi:HAD hydrolase-like protein [Candidatus Daviesbacteria bacterium]|nr:HAD hydrolase-like protein [Candidatus Daviesbacteria bacterium]